MPTDHFRPCLTLTNHCEEGTPVALRMSTSERPGASTALIWAIFSLCIFSLRLVVVVKHLEDLHGRHPPLLLVSLCVLFLDAAYLSLSC